MKTIDIHGKPYVMVKDRIIHFNATYPNGRISTTMIPLEGKYAFKAEAIPDVANPDRYFTGHAEEEIGSSQINKTSALENCETSAIGRALGCMGIGVDESFASGEEVANAVHQQNGFLTPTQIHSQNVANKQVKSDNDYRCPLCNNSGVFDNRVEDVDGRIGVDESFASGEEVANAVHQQENTKTLSKPDVRIQVEKKIQISDNEFQCPKCESGVFDNRVKDADGNFIINEKRHPAFKCKNRDCKFATWETDSLAAEVMPTETTQEQKEEDERHYEAAMSEPQQKSEDLPF